MSKTEKDWFCIAEDRLCADVSGDDDDNSYLDDEEDGLFDEDKFCVEVFHDDED